MIIQRENQETVISKKRIIIFNQETECRE